MRELENKVALVTGAGRGIGRAISIALAQEGAQLILTGRDLETLNETLRLISDIELAPTPLVCQMDLLDSEGITTCVQSALEIFGHIDILVNNSGITGKSAPLWELTEAEWDEGMDTNLKGAFLVSKAVIPSMIERKSGSIIFIGSITGKRPLANRSVYAASKLGMVGMMRTLALELGRYGVRVNHISPGFVEGPRLDGVIAQVAKNENVSPEDMNEQWLEMIPMGKFISPENIAQGVLFFASDRSGGTTGEDLNISGGLVMY
ncbi:MAG: SDR family oxidoreductase [Actinobacteria bacterium]|jgi:NAD(P)-dependent dehydrogenase (short-subunit alcohol dehydrogenase family)|nr:SDR family oxidoreductase [Actinomycetota bacterium]